ncbi:hypothetical protein C1I92_13195 [Jiangella anatolica]|uniref:Zinc finger CHC2-type domain-containing protein n=1 Tax=Jiangella anatolica TaxID=2670374 RepID=A0A2W2C5A7_9ACTN|nr:hypothetical protein C1I92_13195 [Jiangella anatolica]
MVAEVDKGALLVAFLATKGVEVDPEKYGNQKVSCIGHQDRSPSASVDAQKGVYHCFSCNLSGDVYTLIMHDRGVDFNGANEIAQAELRADAGDPSPVGAGRRGRFIPSWRMGASQGSGRFLPPNRR